MNLLGPKSRYDLIEALSIKDDIIADLKAKVEQLERRDKVLRRALELACFNWAEDLNTHAPDITDCTMEERMEIVFEKAVWEDDNGRQAY